MGVELDWQNDWHIAQALLDWQVELGAVDAIGDAPINRFELDARPIPKAAAPIATPAPVAVTIDPVAEAQAMAAAAATLDQLREALAAYPHCELQKGARNLVFSDGQASARVMIVGEAPGRDEDMTGRPFVGEAGQLLDRMLAAIGMDRAHPDPARAVYITNILPYRPPQNRDPSAEERAMFLPFVARHIELVRPEILVLMGRISTGTLLNTAEGITKIRGQWRDYRGTPCLPMLHPAYLLRNPAAKREAWADLLTLQAKLRTK
ncbi:MAG: uracil-DNA glycosylase family protein [Roseinatronobacter sp.]